MATYNQIERMITVLNRIATALETTCMQHAIERRCTNCKIGMPGDWGIVIAASGREYCSIQCRQTLEERR